MSRQNWKMAVYAAGLAVIFLTGGAWGQNQAQVFSPMAVPAPALRVSNPASVYALAPHARLFEDSQRTLSFRDVLARYNSGEGRVLPGDSVSLNYTSSAWWLVFTVENHSLSPRWMLDLGARRDGTGGAADRLFFFSDIPGHPALADGRFVINKMQMPGQEKNAIPLSVGPGQSGTFALYIEPVEGIPFAMVPRLKEQAVYKESLESGVFGERVLLGLTVIFIAVLLAFLLKYGSVIPGFLMLYMVSAFLIHEGTDEIVSRGNNAVVVWLGVIYAADAVAALLLTRQVLFSGPSRKSVLSSLLAVLSFALVVAAGFFPDAAFFFRPLPLALPLFISVLGFAACFRKEQKTDASIPAAFYTLAWLPLSVAALIGEAGSAGLIPAPPSSGNFYWVFFALHLILLFFVCLRFVADAEKKETLLREETSRRQKEEDSFRQSAGGRDQERLLEILKHEKDIVEDLRSREAERLQEVSVAKKAADDANRAKSDFLAVISHEIRTPMTGIMGMIRLLQGTTLDKKQQEYVRTIQYAGDSLLVLINDILDLSKAEHDRIEIESINFDLFRLLESVVLLMSGRADEKKLSLTFEIAPGTPLLLKGDPTRLRQVLLNLINNALKFTEKGGVSLSVSRQDGVGGGYQLLFSVKDTGMGISEEGKKKLFMPYAQEDASVARRFGGTGLGLAICKRLVGAMNGSIGVESTLGSGTTFFFVLPFGVGAAESEDMGNRTIANPLHILVVDDNAINQRVISGLLEKEGHRLVSVGSATAAMKEVDERSFDLILMDMEMPDIDGLAATKLVRALPDLKKASTPIIALTASTNREDILRCLQAGMNDYAQKPINMEKLRVLLQQVVDKEGAFRMRGKPGEDMPPEKISPPPPLPVPSPPPRSSTLAPEEVTGAFAERFKKVSHPDDFFNAETLASLKKGLGMKELQEMVSGLYEKTDTLIGEAERALMERNFSALSRCGHDLCGMTGNFGFVALAALTKKMETEAKAADIPVESLTAIVSELRPTYGATRKIVDAWMVADDLTIT